MTPGPDPTDEHPCSSAFNRFGVEKGCFYDAAPCSGACEYPRIDREPRATDGSDYDASAPVLGPTITGVQGGRGAPPG